MKTKVILSICILMAMIGFAGCTACSNIDEYSSSQTSSDIASSIGGTSSADAPSDVKPDSSDAVSSDLSGNNSTESAVSGEESASPTAALPLTDVEKLDNTSVTWGPGTFFDDKNRPTACVSLQESYGKYSAYFLGEDTNKIYLTFDEGYENGYTSQILNVLKEKNVQAVFFVTMPYAKSQPDLIRRMIDEGHIVGNHSNKHPAMPTVSFEQAQSEYTILHEYIRENFDYTMFLFRPPQGLFSERILALGQTLGYSNVLWSFAYNDWNPENQPDPEKAFEKITSRFHNGEIMLLHAVSKTNTEILGRVIDKAREEGFEFASFEEK